MLPLVLPSLISLQTSLIQCLSSISGLKYCVGGIWDSPPVQFEIHHLCVLSHLCDLSQIVQMTKICTDGESQIAQKTFFLLNQFSWPSWSFTYTWRIWNTNKSALNTDWNISNTLVYGLKFLLKRKGIWPPNCTGVVLFFKLFSGKILQKKISFMPMTCSKIKKKEKNYFCKKCILHSFLSSNLIF